MTAVSHLLVSVALLALVVAGLSVIVQARPLAERLVGYAVVCLGLSYAIPMFAEFLRAAFEAITAAGSPGTSDWPSPVFVPVVVGHLVVAVALVRRRLRGRDRDRDERAEMTRARSRVAERIHLPPPDEREP